ncbi:MAG: methyltransferase [Bernardetiaceae bacterium]
MEKQQIIRSVADYYTEKLAEHGPTPRGVDWNSADSQELRFRQLLQVISDATSTTSILDYGCGFGAMFSFIEQHLSKNIRFFGYDISKNMIQQAEKLYGDRTNAIWLSELKNQEKMDYLVSSGIFNVRLQHQNTDWKAYILDVLHQFDQLSTKGFAFNMLTAYSDKPYMKDYLYYADPMFFFDYCKQNFSPYVALLHDYPLYEFTILVRKQ